MCTADFFKCFHACLPCAGNHPITELQLPHGEQHLNSRIKRPAGSSRGWCRFMAGWAKGPVWVAFVILAPVDTQSFQPCSLCGGGAVAQLGPPPLLPNPECGNLCPISVWAIGFLQAYWTELGPIQEWDGWDRQSPERRQS